MIKLKVSQNETVLVNPEDIDYAEYRITWERKREQYPSIKVFMRDGTIHTVDYADEFRPLIAKLKKYKVQVID